VKGPDLAYSKLIQQGGGIRFFIFLSVNGWFCSALFDACPCLAAMKIRPRSVGRRWTKPGGGNRETRRGRSVGAQRYGHLSAARSRRYAMSMVLRQGRRVA